MNIKSVEIHNIKLIEDEVIEFNENLNLFFGKIKQGKTTIIDSIKLLFGGSYSYDLITHGKNEAYIKLNLLPVGYIKRSFYRHVDGKTIARPKIEYVNTAGEVESQPVRALQQLLNPFLQDQNYFSNMTGVKKKQYFLDLAKNYFGLDISKIEQEQIELKADASKLRAKLSTYGEIELTKVEKPNIDQTREELKQAEIEKCKIKENLSKKRQEISNLKELLNNSKSTLKNISFKIEDTEDQIKQSKNNYKNDLTRIEEEKQRIINTHLISVERLNDAISSLQASKTSIDTDIKSFVGELELKQSNLDIDEAEFSSNPHVTAVKKLEKQITCNQVQNYLYNQYLDNIEKNNKKIDDEEALKINTARYRELEKEKLVQLSNVADKSGIKGLSFDQNGNAIYENTAIDLLSGSQNKTLSSQLQQLYKNDLGLELLDGAESLGESIYTYIDMANNNDRTILATVVGDAPAKFDTQIGVWIVKDGKAEKRDSD